MALIKTENLNYVYSPDTPFEKAAICDINIEINEGEFIGIIGHTGSGKSTLVQHLNGLIRPTSGKIYVDGVDIWQEPKKIRDLRFNVGLVFQYPEYQLFDETVRSDIAFGPKNMGLSEDEINERDLRAADAVGLSRKLLDKSPFDLSGGQKRRAALAGVLAMEPKVLILDEPTAGLDPKGRDTILDRIKEFRKTYNTTVLLVSHSMEDIAKVADRVLVMNKSRVHMFDSVENVFKHSAELSKIGLNVPQICLVIEHFKRKGYTFPDNVYDAEKAADAFYDILKGAKNA